MKKNNCIYCGVLMEDRKMQLKQYGDEIRIIEIDVKYCPGCKETYIDKKTYELIHESEEE